MTKYLKSCFNFALSSILKDLNNPEIKNKSLTKLDAKQTIKQFEKFGFEAVFKLEKTMYVVPAFDLNTLEKVWKILNNESIKELITEGKIDVISFCQDKEECGILVADYELSIDFETGIITAECEYDGELMEIYFENGEESARNFESEIEVEFYGAAERAANMFLNWKTQKEYEERCELREQNNFQSVANHL